MDFDLGPIFDRVGATANFPQAVKDTIVIDGQVVKAPVTIHIDGMLFYNKQVAEQAGVDPAAWRSLDDMFADYDKVKAAGFIPIAVGAQEWQIGYLTHALLAALSGRDIFNSLYGPEPDQAVLDSPEFKATLQTLRKFQELADEGSANRAWQDTTRLVIAGKALLQIHGDWMKSEWKRRQDRRRRLRLHQHPGHQGRGRDRRSLGHAQGRQSRQDRGARTLRRDRRRSPGPGGLLCQAWLHAGGAQRTDGGPRRVQSERNSDPQGPRPAAPTPHNTADAHWRRAIWSTMSRFWANPGMTEDDVIARLKDEYETIF